MKLSSINTGTFKLDGGAMFGVVPKVMWQKVYPADENNLCTWALRCLLIETENRKILIDCGIGNKQSEKFLGHYHITGNEGFEKSLSHTGVTPNEITDVILTHLHFDHCGGAVQHSADKSGFEPTFKNAKYWIGKQQWDLANNPNKRENASYLNENFIPLMEAGKVIFIENNTEIISGISARIYNGHTAGQVIPFINYKGNTLVYMADFIPTTAHIPLPFIISYDTSPLITLAEKEEFLKEAVLNNYILFFEHDNINECCTVHNTEKGVRANKTGLLKDYI
ncbi:MAG: MBL fold metallo-hydrolase [Bacteroidia bacterium]|nr:MBL fold metallo-hydrolase [Bacteroidia bacterium]